MGLPAHPRRAGRPRGEDRAIDGVEDLEGQRHRSGAPTGLVEEARALAAPTLLPATNDTQNDIASPSFGAYRSQHRAAECLDSVLAILALVSSQALSVTSRHPAPPLAGLLNGIRSVFPPVQTEREGQGTQAAELAAIFSRVALTGQPDFPSHRAQASPPPSP